MNSPVKPKAIVAGYIVRYPQAGNALSQLDYLIGLHRLGYDVLFVEHHGWPEACYDADRRTMTDDPRYGIRVLQDLFAGAGLRHWCYVAPNDQYFGLSQSELRQWCAEAELLLSVAATTWVEEFRECRQRVFIDTDPVFTQLRMPARPTPSQPGFASPWDFQHHFSLGELLHAPGCPVPLHGLKWRPTRWPLIADRYTPQFTPDAPLFTTVMSWDAYGAVTHNGETYGQKDVEVLRFLDLPQQAGAVFELALGGKAAPLEKLQAAGWHTRPAGSVTGLAKEYLGYIGQSRGEFSFAKNGYVKARTGWFSERTLKYLACGKPAIVQDTGFSELLPTGRGIFAFQDTAGVCAAVEALQADYAAHCAAARDWVCAHFDYRQVLGQLLAAVGLR